MRDAGAVGSTVATARPSPASPPASAAGIVLLLRVLLRVREREILGAMRRGPASVAASWVMSVQSGVRSLCSLYVVRKSLVDLVCDEATCPERGFAWPFKGRWGREAQRLPCWSCRSTQLKNRQEARRRDKRRMLTGKGEGEAHEQGAWG